METRKRATEAAARLREPDGEGGTRRIPMNRLTRQVRRHAEAAIDIELSELDPSGMNRAERRKYKKLMQKRDAEQNRWLAEQRAAPEYTDLIDELLEE